MLSNLPYSPGAIIGYRRNGIPIRVIAGASGEGEGEAGSTEGQDGGAGGSADDGGGQTDGTEGGGGSGRNERGQFAGNDPDKTARTIEAIRGDFKDERAKRQAAESELASVKEAQAKLQQALDADKAERDRQMDLIGKAMGWKPDDAPLDPAKLAAELKESQEKAQSEITRRDASIRQSQIELAVLRNAGKHGGNGDALLDSRSFMAKANGLDPSSGSFAGDLADAIKGAVESGPQYKAASPGGSGSGDRKPPARSGGEHTAPGGNRQWTAEEAKAVAKSDPQALQRAINDGLLTGIGYFPSTGPRR